MPRGNLATASPISDMNPLLISLVAVLMLASRPSADGGIERRSIPVLDFFVLYQRVWKVDVLLIEHVDMPLVLERWECEASFKQARRREDNISIITTGMQVKLAVRKAEGGEKYWIIKDVGIAFGGMEPKTVIAKDTTASMLAKPFSEATFVRARGALQE